MWHVGGILGVMAALVAFLHLTGATHVRDWKYRNLGSLRAWLSSVTGAVVSVGVPAWLLSLVWSGFGYLFYSVYLLIPLSMLAFMAPGNQTPLHCEACRARVRMTASVCRRCGHDHARSRSRSRASSRARGRRRSRAGLRSIGPADASTAD